jgi:hypothetical protein
MLKSCLGDLQQQGREHRVTMQGLIRRMLQARRTGVRGDSKRVTFLSDHLFQESTPSRLRRAAAGGLNGKTKGTLHKEILRERQANLFKV